MRTENRQTVAAVVVTYNRKDLLRECLNGILAQTRPVDAIYVIDNASTDGTERMIAEEYAHKVIHVRMPENTGSSGGFHYGMKLAHEAEYDWIWVMDDDTRPLTETLTHLLAACLSDPTVVGVGPVKHSPDGEFWIGESVVDEERQEVCRPRPESYLSPAFAVDYVTFPGLLIRGRAVQQAGLPRAELFLWLDDSEYCCRLHRAGRLVIAPAAVVVHPRPEAFCPAALPPSSYWKHYYGHRNLIYLRSALKPPRSLSGLLYSTVRQALAIVIKRDHKAWRLRVLVTATLDGLKGRLGKGPAWLLEHA
jgi:GT2 family glycosyltransferase